MKLTDERLDELLAASSPARVTDAALVRTTVVGAVSSFPESTRGAKRGLTIGAIVGGLVVASLTAAALPSIFEGFGRVDYQSSQQYTVDGRGPFRCEFGFRIDPAVDGNVLEPSDDSAIAAFAEILTFVQTHDWAFDDQPVALTTPTTSERQYTDLGVMSDFISTSWRAEVEAAYPGWMARVSEINEIGQCLSVADGSSP